jgi:hypothetical protein
MGVLVAAAFAIGTAVPASAADPCLDLPLQCDGFEPNWQFTTSVNAGGETVIRFIDPENPNWETEPFVLPSCLLQGSPNDYELSAPPPLSLIAAITDQNCTLPNDEVVGFSVSASFNQGALGANPNPVSGTGCCKRLP